MKAINRHQGCGKMEIVNTPTLETERLILRKFTEKDLEALYRLLQDQEVNTFLPWFPLKSMDEARTFFEERFAALTKRPAPIVTRSV